MRLSMMRQSLSGSNDAGSPQTAAAAAAAKKWDAKQIPPQTGKVAVVTGAHKSIGFVVARELARKGAHVVLTCHSEEKGLDAVNRLREEIDASGDKSEGEAPTEPERESAEEEDEEPIPVGSVEFMHLDVGNLANVHEFARAFSRKFDRLDLLIHHADIMGVPYAQTIDGHESQFANNYLGPFALTAELFFLLKQGAPSRVVHVGSIMQKMARLDSKEFMTAKNKYSWPNVVYGNTKACNLLFAFELARRLKAQGIDGVSSVACHPGYSSAKLIDSTAPADKEAQPAPKSNMFGRMLSGLKSPFVAQTPEMGALPTLYAATAPDVSSGQYFTPSGHMRLWGHPGLDTPPSSSQSQDVAAKLWDYSEHKARLSFRIEGLASVSDEPAQE